MKKRTSFILGMVSLLFAFSSCVEELDIKEGSKDFQVDHSIALPIQKKKFLVGDFFDEEKTKEIKTYSDLIDEVKYNLSQNKIIESKYEITGISKNLEDVDVENEGLEKGVLFVKCSNSIPFSAAVNLSFLDAKDNEVKISGLKTTYNIEFPMLEGNGNVKESGKSDFRIELNAAQLKELGKVDKIFVQIVVDGEELISKENLNVNLNDNNFLEVSLGVFVHVKKVIKE